MQKHNMCIIKQNVCTTKLYTYNVIYLNLLHYKIEKRDNPAKRNTYYTNCYDPCLEVLRMDVHLIQTSFEERRVKRSCIRHNSGYWRE